MRPQSNGIFNIQLERNAGAGVFLKPNLFGNAFENITGKMLFDQENGNINLAFKCQAEKGLGRFQTLAAG